MSAAGTPVSGILRLGGYPTGTGGRAAAIAADLAGSSFSVPLEEDVMRWKYTKLLGNLANALDAVAGRIEDGPLGALRDRVTAEGAAVLAAAGVPHHDLAEQFVEARETLRLAPVAGEGRTGSSSWQSLARGTGSIEADHLNGEIVLLARLHGVAAPLNEALQRLAGAFARTGRAPGSLTAEELAALTAL
ncbi:ketopantoate reductase family protein [Streptomyces sp. BE303]|uniref:ketopantoate reductase family protein n=1 Tax=Streptomyces sp. BE303 TaxID=3002528 RepID=UPI002E78789F|nr:ketopantoate reductase C-terminal domain-containing protein [Streptomyces sp. BE303]